HAVHRDADRRGIGVPGIGDAANLLQGLGDAGKGQDTVVDGEAHAADTSKGEGVVRSRCSSGASVAAITAPPRQTSPSYSTSDCPGVTARCGCANTTCRVPSSRTTTVHGSSGCR